MSDKPGGGFVSLSSLKGGTPKTADEILSEIRRIYFKTTKQTAQNDLAHAIELLKMLPDEETRERAHVYMEGLAEMRKEWERRKVKTGKSKGESKFKSKK